VIHKPKFIDKIQRIHAGAIRLAKLDSAATATADGSFPVDAFPPGLAPMAEDDWRQFRMTAENAVKMVDTANQAIAAGKKLRYNYGHDRSGPIAGQIVRVEITPGGGVRSFVNWTERASASIQAGEWEGTSPEFYARVIQDENGEAIEENGRVLMEPFELVGGALDNDPAMPDLAIAANTEPEKPEGAKGEPIMETKVLAAMLGLPETATNEDCKQALEAAAADKKTVECPKCGMKFKAAAESQHTCEPVTVEAVAAAVLAHLDPKKLAAEIGAAAKTQALEAFRAEEHEKAVVQTVDAAIRGGRVKKSERDAALKVAKADLESFKTMTASMKVIALVTPIYQAGGEATPGSIDENDPGNDEAFVEAAEKRATEKKIPIMQAARELRAEAAAK
jgi:hypothetical protein